MAAHGDRRQLCLARRRRRGGDRRRRVDDLLRRRLIVLVADRRRLHAPGLVRARRRHLARARRRVVLVVRQSRRVEIGVGRRIVGAEIELARRHLGRPASHGRPGGARAIVVADGRAAIHPRQQRVAGVDDGRLVLLEVAARARIGRDVRASRLRRHRRRRRSRRRHVLGLGLQIREREDERVLVAHLDRRHHAGGVGRVRRRRPRVALVRPRIVAHDLAHEGRQPRARKIGREAVQELLQRLPELACRRESIVGSLLQAAHDHRLELARHAHAMRRRRRDGSLAHDVEQLLQVLLDVEHLPDDHFVEQDPGGEDVGARVDRIAPGLLGRHVVVLALDDAGGGLLPAQRRLGDAEVDDLDLAVVADEHVLRRDVAMHDLERAAARVTLAVRVVEPLRHLGGDERGHLEGKVDVVLGRAPQELVQIDAVDQLHGDVVLLVDAAEVERLHDVGVGAAAPTASPRRRASARSRDRTRNWDG